jgi:hypothetical protein
LHQAKAVSDATYARALKAFGEQGVIDTIGITGYYTLLAMTLNTAQRRPASQAARCCVRFRSSFVVIFRFLTTESCT